MINIKTYTKNLEHQNGVKELYLNESEIPELLKDVNTKDIKRYVNGSNAHALYKDGTIKEFKFDEAFNEWIELKVVNGGGGVSQEYIDEELIKKVDKVEGKGLSTLDFTPSKDAKLNSLNNYTHPNDANTRHVTDIEKNTWNAKSNFNGDYNDLANKPNIPALYTHPTNSGNKHIPNGGSVNQILRWSTDGTAVWGNDNNTTYGACSTSTLGLTKKCELQADSVATTLEELITDYNSLLAKLKTAGLM